MSNFLENNPIGELNIAYDTIERPKHYHKGGLDPLTVMKYNFSKERQMGFHTGNVLKYIMRYEEKGGIEDLKKARFYIQEAIELAGE